MCKERTEEKRLREGQSSGKKVERVRSERWDRT